MKANKIRLSRRRQIKSNEKKSDIACEKVENPEVKSIEAQSMKAENESDKTEDKSAETESDETKHKSPKAESDATESESSQKKQGEKSPYKVLKLRTRYIIPFEIKKEKGSEEKELDFEEICKRIDGHTDYPFRSFGKDMKTVDGSPLEGKWIRETLHQSKKELKGYMNIEQDLYDHIIEEFEYPFEKNKEIGDVVQKTGCYWHYKLHGKSNADKKQEENIKLKFELKYKGLKREFDFAIVDMGLYVFRSMIGFLWYEIEFSSKEFPNSEELVFFQNSFKELSYSNSPIWISKENSSLPVELKKLLENKKIATGDYHPFSMGNWLAQRLDIVGIEISYQAKRENLYPKQLVSAYFPKELNYKKEKDETVYYDDNLNPIIENEDKGNSETQKTELENRQNFSKHKEIQDNANTSKTKRWEITENILHTTYKQEKPDEEEIGKKSSEINSDKKILPTYCPDKAILFTYAVFDRKPGWTKDWEALRTVFYLTNGYKSSYEMSEYSAGLIKNPFSNVSWFASGEGCGYFAWVEKNNKTFFKEIQYHKVMFDYFLIYIKVLHQSFSLMKYSVYILDELPSFHNCYLDEDCENSERTANKVANIRATVNLFVLRSVVTSVSHIHHQNEFYVYLTERMYIKKDMDALMEALEALGDLRQQTLDRKEEKARQQEEKNGRENPMQKYSRHLLW